MSAHWSENVDRVGGSSRFLVGEDDDGRWYCRGAWSQWYPFEWWNPLHWMKYVGSRVSRRIVWLERAS